MSFLTTRLDSCAGFCDLERTHLQGEMLPLLQVEFLGVWRDWRPTVVWICFLLLVCFFLFFYALSLAISKSHYFD